MTRRVLLLARLETRLFLREPVAVFFSFAFPLLMLAFVGGVYGRQVSGGVRFIDEYFPLMVGVSAANLGVMGMSLHLAENRARGVLRRYRLSPIGAMEFFAGHILTSAGLLAISLSGLAAFTLAVYGPAPNFRPLVFSVGVLVTMYAMFSLGVFVGGLRIPTRSNQVLGSVLFFFMFFSSGAAIPRSAFPEWMRWFSAANPLSHLAEALSAGYVGLSAVPVLPLAVVLAAAVLLNLVTRWTFDWEGRS
jgi:ABC-2 type transport system permease protein